MKEQWIKDMQDRFADFEQPAPEGLLGDIQREMERRGLVPVDKTGDAHRGLIPLWMRGAAAAAIVAVAIGTGTFLLMDDDGMPKPVAQEQTIDTQTQPTYIEEPKNEMAEAEKITPETKQLIREHNNSGVMPVASAVINENLMVETLPDAEVQTEQTYTELPPTIIEDEAQDMKQEGPEQESNDEYRTATPAVTQSPSTASTKFFQPKHSKSGNKRWEIGASVAGMQGLGDTSNSYLGYVNRLSANDMNFISSLFNSNNTVFNSNNTVIASIHGHVDFDGYIGYAAGAGDFGDSDYPPPTPTYPSNPTLPIEDNNNGGIIVGFSNYSSNYIPTRSFYNINGDYMVKINNLMYPMVVDTHHRQPVKVGLSLRYHFNDRWSLQAGVDYSYHSSDLVLQIENVQIQSEQKLHFVGVPVALSYTLWSPGRFNIYVSGGGEIEKVVKGSQSTMSMASNMADKKERQDVEEKPWQISIGGSAGVQFSITKLLSIYAEPGVAYYFDNKSNLPTIYQERPLNFNINMGLRINMGK